MGLVKKNRTIVFIIIGIVIVAGIYFANNYNAFVKRDEKVMLQWNEVQNAYQRRLNLVPNIVNVVKGVSEFEQTTLLQITEARAKAASININTNNVNPDEFKQQVIAQDELASATNQLIIRIEKYPTLKGTAAYAGLQTQLEGTERRIKVARKDFNEAINDYNNAVRSFPSSIGALLFGFGAKEGFQSDAGADQTIEIKF